MAGNLGGSDIPDLDGVIAKRMSGYALKVDVPAFSSSMPSAEAKTASAGASQEVPRSDHQHPRLTSATVSTTDANGKKTVMFTRTFPNQPIVMCDLVEAADNGPVTFKVESFLDDTGAAWQTGKPYGGAIIYAYRTRQLPTLTALTVVTFVLAGVNALFASLSGYAPYAPAGNVGFSCLAIMQSTT